MLILVSIRIFFAVPTFFWDTNEEEINSKAKIIKLKEWDTLRDLCEEYYWKWSISTIILIPKLWYREKIKIWEDLPLPLRKYILPLINKGIPEDEPDDNQKVGDMEIKWDFGEKYTTSNPKPVKPKRTRERKLEKTKQADHKEKFWKIRKKEVPIDQIKQNWQREVEQTRKDLLKEEKKEFLEKFLQIYAEYVKTHLDDTVFDNAKNHQDYIQLLQWKLLTVILSKNFKSKEELQRTIEDKLLQVFKKDTRWTVSKFAWKIFNINSELENQINFLSKTIANILFAKDNKELERYEKESILKLRKLDINDREFGIFNLKEANLNGLIYQKLFEEKQIDFKENEYVKENIEKIERINLDTINQIQEIYYQDPIIVWDEKIYKEYWNWKWEININKE